MDRAENFRFARDWAVQQRRAGIARACRFASWYAEEYPEGDEPLSTAWTNWLVEVAR